MIKEQNTLSGKGGAFRLVYSFLPFIFSSAPTLHLAISHCLFVNNSAATGGAVALYFRQLALFLEVSNSQFTRNRGKDGGALCVTNNHGLSRQNSVIMISWSFFDQNLATRSGSAVYFKFDSPGSHTNMFFVLNTTKFVQNMIQEDKSKEGKGGALFFSALTQPSKVICHIQQCQWENNNSTTHGGALALYVHESSSLHIEQSDFINNTAQATGGALYLNIGKGSENIPLQEMTTLDNCRFSNNIALEGGSVFQTSLFPLQAQLVLKNTSFFCSDTVTTDFISLVMFALFMDTFFYQSLQKDAVTVFGLILKSDGPYLLQNVYFSCHDSDIKLSMNSISMDEEHTHKNYSDAPLNSLLLSCTRCAVHPFAAGNSSLSLNPKDPSVTNLKTLFQHEILLSSSCQPCPFGGDCSKGEVKALPNYWGYKRGEFIFFLSCPLHYCCNGIDVLCDAYNTCALKRTGQLCGRCQEGFSESLMSTTCIADEKCDDSWLWPLGFLLAFCYLMWYMYKGKIVSMLKQVGLRVCACHKHKVFAQPDNANCHPNEHDNENADSAYFDILVYFVNIIGLIEVHVEFQKKDTQAGALYDMERYFMKYLDIDIQHTLNIDVCPFSGTDAMVKTLSRPIFTVMVFVIWTMFFSICVSLIHVMNRNLCRLHYLKYFLKHFKQNLIEGYVETMKYSYSGLAGATFILLTCVKIGDHHFWKYDAEVMCFSKVQNIVIVFAAFYTVPFVFISPIAGKLLTCGVIGHIQVMLACIFPFPFVFIWSVRYILLEKSWAQNLNNSCENSVRSNTGVLSKEAKILLDTYQGPYKERFSYWEGIIETRKLMFCSFFLIYNNIYRLIFSAALSVVVLVHHNATQPFKHVNSNRAETLSLSLLCMSCITNCDKSVYPQSGLIIEFNTPTEQLLYFMNRLDNMFALILLLFIFVAELHDIVKKAMTRKFT